MSDTRLLPNSHDEHRRPYNIYYTIPYFELILYSYAFIGGFTIAWITDYLSAVGTTCLWLGFATTCGLMIATHPSICTDRTGSNETGMPVRVRRPLIGFKRWEVALDVDGIDNGLYDAPDGNTDPKLHDGYRYGYA